MNPGESVEVTTSMYPVRLCLGVQQGGQTFLAGSTEGFGALDDLWRGLESGNDFD